MVVGCCGGGWTVGDGDATAWHPTLAGRASRYCFAATLVNSGDSARGGQPVGAFIDWVLIRAARWLRLKLTIFVVGHGRSALLSFGVCVGAQDSGQVCEGAFILAGRRAEDRRGEVARALAR